MSKNEIADRVVVEQLGLNRRYKSTYSLVGSLHLEEKKSCFNSMMEQGIHQPYPEGLGFPVQLLRRGDMLSSLNFAGCFSCASSVVYLMAADESSTVAKKGNEMKNASICAAGKFGLAVMHTHLGEQLEQFEFLSFHIWYRDEDSEPLMDYDDVQSDREPSPEPLHQLDDYEDDVNDEWRGRDRSQTPVYDNDAARSKPRKRLTQKSDAGKQSVVPQLEDEEEDGYVPEARFEEEDGGKRKKGKEAGKDHDGEVKEMWDTIAGGDSEDDDNFIDDTGVEPDYYGSDEPRTPLAEEAEEDADLDRQRKPAINKLKMLTLLTEVLSKPRAEESSSRQHASSSEATPLNPDEIRARPKQAFQDEE
ncbi:hypothetical protein VNO80_05629 [Phaseolus coccineus]|uniref:Uncharacterized protein n=1 Tax=Phaseolus coccineus TaxID=3886 RepID=A0AAN9NFE8_PHACN